MGTLSLWGVRADPKGSCTPCPLPPDLFLLRSASLWRPLGRKSKAEKPEQRPDPSGFGYPGASGGSLGGDKIN